MKTPLKHILFILGILLLNQWIHFILKGVAFTLGPVRLELVFNTAFIFGLFNEASHLVRIVVNGVMLGILSIIACYFYEFLHPSLKKLRWGITILLSGIIGNGIEKLFYGYVWDFMSLNVGGLSKYYFNINDVIQIAGLILVVTEVFRNQHVIWFPAGGTKRKSTLIYKEIQLPMLWKVCGLIFIGSITQAILTVALVFPHLKRGTQDIQLLFYVCLFLLNIALIPLMGKYLLRELLRCLGPIYALERYLKNNDFEKELKFRKTDHFQSLESILNEVMKKKKNQKD